MKVKLLLFLLFCGGIILFWSVNDEKSALTSSSLPNFGKAPELQGIAGWINSEPFSLESQRGRVVLVDFWTYSCINCIRTLPHLRSWHEKYADKGLVIIGVHTPEFNFEKEYGNVKKAVEENGILYAVALDNDYQTWRAYKNAYWPRKYLIDKEGNIRYDHIGEGAYKETETAIVQLLSEIKNIERNQTEIFVDPNLGQAFPGVTGETYVGYERGLIGNAEGYKPGELVHYQDTGVRETGKVYFQGPWFNHPEYMELRGEGHLAIKYAGSVVNLVLSSPEAAVLEISVDGKHLNENTKGNDVLLQEGRSMVTIDSSRLYNLVGMIPPGEHEIKISSAQSFQAYAFTFGI